MTPAQHYRAAADPKLLSAIKLSAEPARPKELSGLQRLIVILTAMSWNRKQIAEAVMRSVKTVEYHLDCRIPLLTGGNDPALLTHYALNHGWLQLKVKY